MGKKKKKKSLTNNTQNTQDAKEKKEVINKDNNINNKNNNLTKTKKKENVTEVVKNTSVKENLNKTTKVSNTNKENKTKVSKVEVPKINDNTSIVKASTPKKKKKKKAPVKETVTEVAKNNSVKENIKEKETTLNNTNKNVNNNTSNNTSESKQKEAIESNVTDINEPAKKKKKKKKNAEVVQSVSETKDINPNQKALDEINLVDLELERIIINNDLTGKVGINDIINSEEYNLLRNRDDNIKDEDNELEQKKINETTEVELDPLKVEDIVDEELQQQEEEMKPINDSLTDATILTETDKILLEEALEKEKIKEEIVTREDKNKELYEKNEIIKKEKKSKKKKTTKIIALIFIIIAIPILAYSAYQMVIYSIDSPKTKATTEKIRDEVIINDNVDSENSVIPETTEPPNTPYWNFIKMNLMDVDFSKLKETNSDTVGWIKVEGTNVNYPIVRGEDNDFYLTHSFDKSKNGAGWVFMDYRNDKDNYGRNTIIYGHNRADKTMFGTLKLLLYAGWYSNESNRIIKMSSDTYNTLWQIFSVYTIETTNDYIQTNFKNDDEFKAFEDLILSRSYADFNTTVTPQDKILTLSTCHGNTKKLVVHAKLIKYEPKLN